MKQFLEFYKNKNILVTGGAGFIGSHIVEKLVEYKANVTIIDNFSTGKLTNIKKYFSKIKIVYGDITNPFTCKKITLNKDIIFHLAALTSVSYSIKNPKVCYKINIDGTKNLLEGCKKNGVKKFVFSSSAAVYGNRENKCRETDTPNPISPYGKSKLEAEKLCKKYQENLFVDTICLRYFNVYGEKQNSNGEYAAVVAKFRENIKNHKPLIIFGDGKQKRDFITVEMVVDANLKLAAQKELGGEIINIASGKSITLLELIEQLKSETKTENLKLIFKPLRPGDIQKSLADCTKYQKLKFDQLYSNI